MIPDDDSDNVEDNSVVEEEEDADANAEPRSPWSTASEITGGLLALLLVTVGVLVVYLAGGVVLAVAVHLLTTAAPVILALAAALLLARYLSRR